MDGYVESGPTHIIIDLSSIDFVDSSGLGALVQLVKNATLHRKTVQVVTNNRVTQTVKLVRLENFLSLQATVEDAIEKIQSQTDSSKKSQTDSSKPKSDSSTTS